MVNQVTQHAPVIGFCRCPRPITQSRAFGPGAYRENLLIDATDLDNTRRRCATCKSTYSAAAPLRMA